MGKDIVNTEGKLTNTVFIGRNDGEKLLMIVNSIIKESNII